MDRFMGRLWRFQRRWTAGQSLVEFALVLPIAMLVVLMVIDFSRVYLGWVNLNNMARIGANFAALNPTAWQGSGNASIQAQYAAQMQADANAINCTLPSPLPAPTFPDPSPDTYNLGSRASVTLQCNFQLLTPFLGSIIGNPVAVQSSAVFPIRGGSVSGIPIGTAPPSATPSPTPTASASPSSSPSSPTATPSTSPPTVAFYGTPSEGGYDSTKVPPVGPHSQGGGLGSAQVVVAWDASVPVTWTKQTTGTITSCSWSFGSGTSPTSSSSCSPSSSVYTTAGTYTVTLQVTGPGGTVSATPYTVVAACQVPSFAGVGSNKATAAWTKAGFAAGNITILPPSKGNGTYTINTQSLTGGALNPAGGCSGATITVGP